jgi:hypothetical protein
VSEATGTEPEYVVNPATGEALELSTEATRRDRLRTPRRIIDLKRALDEYATFTSMRVERAGSTA